MLEMVNINKSFPGVRALQDVTFQLRDGEIHGLIGENGAGKSTLMKILAGIYHHDHGEIRFQGSKQGRWTARVIERLGIQFIHQERHVVPYLTVAESLFLGIEPTYSPLKLINRRNLEKQASKVLQEKVGLVVEGNKLVGELTVGEQQLVQICRALLQNPKVIVFDEPTAVLAKREANRLFEIIRELQKNKIAIIYISHYFGEIIDICDRITVLRNGQKVDTVGIEGLTIEDMVQMTVGREIVDQFSEKNQSTDEVLLEVKDLTHKTDFRHVDFSVRKGEIVGITGLMGSGHTSLGMSIYDHYGVVNGVVQLEGKPLGRLKPEGAIAKGIGYVPEDRRNLGIVQDLSVRENITLASLKRVSRGSVINQKAEKQKVASLIERLAIRTPNQEEPVNFLSGGNQQKVVISKWLSSGAKLYILNQPTAAVDVGAKAEIYSLIHELAKEGAGILLISQDLQELVGLSNRILVMFRGEIIDELEGSNVTTDQVLVSMMGGEQNGTDDKIS